MDEDEDVFEYGQFLIGCTCEHDFHGWDPEDGCEECECKGHWEE